MRRLAARNDLDLWCEDECHFQQHGTRCTQSRSQSHRARVEAHPALMHPQPLLPNGRPDDRHELTEEFLREIQELTGSQELLRGWIHQSDLPPFSPHCCITFAEVNSVLRLEHPQKARGLIRFLADVFFHHLMVAGGPVAPLTL